MNTMKMMIMILITLLGYSVHGSDELRSSMDRYNIYNDQVAIIFCKNGFIKNIYEGDVVEVKGDIVHIGSERIKSSDISYIGVKNNYTRGCLPNSKICNVESLSKIGVPIKSADQGFVATASAGKFPLVDVTQNFEKMLSPIGFPIIGKPDGTNSLNGGVISGGG